MRKEDKSLLDVENVETTGVGCCHMSRRTPLNCSLCTFIGMKHISPTFRYIIPMYLRLKTFTKTLPKCNFTYIFCYFSALGLHSELCRLLECSQISSCPRQLQTFARLMQGWVASAGWPTPNKNPGYAGDLRECILVVSQTFGYRAHIHERGGKHG